MLNKLSNRLAAASISLGLVGLLVVPALTSAQVPTPNSSNFGLNTNFNNVGVKSDRDIQGTIAQIINIILGFLGIIAVIIILAGGFKWMTAGGNEAKVGEARKMIIQGVIGLVIIFAAWAIAAFVVTQLKTATGI